MDTTAQPTAIVEFSIVSLFSMRSPTTNAFTARSLLCPTPAAVKLGLLSRLIARDGPERGQDHLTWLASLSVAWRPPARMAVTATTVAVWKDNNGKTPLISSVGMREYVHAAEPFALAVGGIPADRHEDFSEAIACIRHFGVTESLVQPLRPPRWEPVLPDDFVLLTAEQSAANGAISCVMDDLGDAPSFERLSPFRPNERASVPQISADRRRRVLTLPLRVTQWGADGYTVEALRVTGGGP